VNPGQPQLYRSLRYDPFVSGTTSASDPLEIRVVVQNGQAAGVGGSRDHQIRNRDAMLASVSKGALQFDCLGHDFWCDQCRVKTPALFEHVFVVGMVASVAAADAAAGVVARRQRAGKAVEIRDAQIAGIALARRASVATRNISHFRDLGVRLVDPWSPAGRPKR
jgi:hypothetical protein